VSEKPTYSHYLPFVLLYCFANNFLLPEGLLYTTLLTPVLLYWLYKTGKLKYLLIFSILLLIPIPFQLSPAIDMKSFLISTTLVMAAFIFLITSYFLLKKLNNVIEDIFSKVLVINMFLVFLAMLLLPIDFISQFLWDFKPISPGVPEFPRLMLLAYEPSHYALLLSPVFIYFILRILKNQIEHPLLYLLAVLVPLFLTLSFGVIGAIAIALMIVVPAYHQHLSRNNKSFLINGGVLTFALILAFYFAFPEFPVFERLHNILEGKDTSTKGRLLHSFMFAHDLISANNVFFGLGPGQIKILAHDLIVNFYKYEDEYAEIVRIPNTMGEMLATYGFYGFILKILITSWLFFYFKIYRNMFSLSLFIFIFIYQFTGSFIINAAEMGIWAMVYGLRLPRFEWTNKAES